MSQDQQREILTQVNGWKSCSLVLFISFYGYPLRLILSILTCLWPAHASHPLHLPPSSNDLWGAWSPICPHYLCIPGMNTDSCECQASIKCDVVTSCHSCHLSISVLQAGGNTIPIANQSINQSINHSINQSINQSINSRCISIGLLAIWHFFDAESHKHSTLPSRRSWWGTSFDALEWTKPSCCLWRWSVHTVPIRRATTRDNG